MAMTMKAMFYHGAQRRIDYQNSGSAIAVGDVVVMEDRIGVCTSPEGIAASGVGSLGAIAIGGIFKLIKTKNVATAVFLRDQQVWWDTSAKLAYNAPGSNRVFAGLAVEDASQYLDYVPTDINQVPAQQVVDSMMGAGTTTTSTTSTTTT